LLGGPMEANRPRVLDAVREALTAAGLQRP
jgi:hypothetical protein